MKKNVFKNLGLLTLLTSGAIALVSCVTAQSKTVGVGDTYKLTYTGAKGTEDYISKNGIWAGNSNGSFDQVSDSTASDGTCGKFTQSGESTYKVYAWANVNGTAYTEANTFAVYFKYKTDANNPQTTLKFEWAGDWLIKDTITDATTDWKERYFTFTITDTGNLGNGTCLFDLGGKGTMYVDDFSCIPIVKTYTYGDALGDLPAYYDAQGRVDGEWQVDGVTITSATTYNWEADKSASVHFAPTEYTTTYRYESPNSLASNIKYWHEESAVMPTVSEGETTLTKNDGTQLNYRCYDNNETLVEANKTYELSFDMKTSASVYLSLQWNISTVGWIGEISGPTGWQNLSSYTNQKVTLTPTSTGVVIFDFHFNSGTGTITIKNLKLTRVDSSSVNVGVAVGTLPSIPARDGYTADGWYVGETKIDETYVPSSNVTIVSKYTKNLENYALRYHLYDEAYRTNMSKDKDNWYKIGNANGSISFNDNGLVISGDSGLMYRYIVSKLEDGKTYHISMKLNTGSDGKVHIVINNDWSSTIKAHVQKTTLTEYSYDFVAPAKVDTHPFIDFQISVGTSVNIEIQDFYIHEVKEVNAVEDTPVGTLEEAIQGSKWVSTTGTTLTAETVLTEDTDVYLAPVVSSDSYPETYHVGQKLDLDLEGEDLYSEKELTYTYTWVEEKDSLTSKDTLDDSDVNKSYYLKITATDSNSISNVIYSSQKITILERDTVAPVIYLDGAEYTKTSLNVYVKVKTYLYFSLTATDNVDGNVEVVLEDTTNVLDIFGRVAKAGTLTLKATDSSENEATVVVNINII